VLASPLLVEIDTVPDARQPRPDSISKIAVIEFRGEITFESGSYFRNRFRTAKAAGADLLIIDIDAFGIYDTCYLVLIAKMFMPTTPVVVTTRNAMLETSKTHYLNSFGVLDIVQLADRSLAAFA